MYYIRHVLQTQSWNYTGKLCINIYTVYTLTTRYKNVLWAEQNSWRKPSNRVKSWSPSRSLSRHRSESFSPFCYCAEVLNLSIYYSSLCPLGYNIDYFVENQSTFRKKKMHSFSVTKNKPSSHLEQLTTRHYFPEEAILINSSQVPGLEC
jgi:hypothetical protein